MTPLDASSSIPLNDRLQRLLETLDSAEVPSFMLLLQAIYDTRYNGPITLHCAGGQVCAVELGQPIRYTFTPPKRRVSDPWEPVAGSAGLDTPGPSQAR